MIVDGIARAIHDRLSEKSDFSKTGRIGSIMIIFQIFNQKCDASAQVRTHDLVSAWQTHYQLRYGVPTIETN